MTVKVIADTSVWVEFLRGSYPIMQEILLDENVVLYSHEMVLGELLLGGLKEQTNHYRAFDGFKRSIENKASETKDLITRKQLNNTGIGYVDASLLATCLRMDAKLVTLDTKLKEQAKRLGVLYDF